MRAQLLTAKLLSAMIAVGFAAPAVAATSASAPLATPAGITFQKTRTGVIFADASGKSIYAADAACTGPCLQDWTPVMAAADVKAVGDWSVNVRDDGSKQWALHGKPLYTSAKDERPGDVKGTADGWHVATFQAPAPPAMPPDIGVREIPALPGQVMVNAESHTLYAGPLDCTAKCAETWMPVAAPALAAASGDFTAVKRKDGLRQWAYKGAPLYTYAGDIDDGDLHGRDADKRFQVAALVTYFIPSGVTIRENPDDVTHPNLLADANGHTLYAREHWLYTQTFHAKDGDRNSSNSGRSIGTQGCVNECLKQWHPLAAPTDAVSSGHWTVLTRDDGSKQWAYQNFALYTYSGDEKPGDTRGNERFDLWEKNVVGLPPPIPTSTASVMYWRAASP